MPSFTKLSGIELLLVLFAACADLFSILLSATGVGAIITIVSSFFTSLMLGGGLYLTGNLNIKQGLLMLFGEEIPVLNILPIYTYTTLHMIAATQKRQELEETSIHATAEATRADLVKKQVAQMQEVQGIQTAVRGAQAAQAANKTARAAGKAALTALLFFSSASVVNGAAEIIVSPPNPGSFTDVTLRVQDFNVDIARATITWSVGGKTVASGVGVTSVQARTGASGTPLTVSVTVDGAGTLPSSQNLTIRPLDIDLLWQANSYTPPFYKGKGLLSGGGSVRVVAEPELFSSGVKIAKERLVYTWSVDGKIVQSASGYGKHTLTATHNMLRTTLIVSVKVESVDGSIVGTREIVIPIRTPEIHFYEENPLLGTVYRRALDSGVILATTEGTVRVEPYFLSLSALRTGKMTWTIDGSTAPTPEGDPTVLVLSNPERNARATTIGFEYRNDRELLQSAKNSFVVTPSNE